jgi:hypothetical protein
MPLNKIFKIFLNNLKYLKFSYLILNIEIFYPQNQIIILYLKNNNIIKYVCVKYFYR